MPEEIPLEAKISGRRVDFPSKEGLAWGIETDIPVTSTIREELNREYISIPETITTIKFVHLAPQENLSKRLRTVSKSENFWWKDPLQELVNPDVSAKIGLNTFESQQSQELVKLFEISLNGMPFKRKREFNEKIKKELGSTIVIVIGHSGFDPWSIGEQGSNDDPVIKDEQGHILQKKDNSVPATEILAKYGDPGKFAFILFASCYLGKEKPPSQVPYARIWGLADSIFQRFGWSITQIISAEKSV